MIIGKQGVCLVQTQRESGAQLKIKGYEAPDIWPEERFIHISGSLASQHSAVESILRTMWGETLDAECKLKVVIPADKVPLASSVVMKLLREYGVKVEVNRVRVCGVRWAWSRLKVLMPQYLLAHGTSCKPLTRHHLPKSLAQLKAHFAAALGRWPVFGARRT